MIMKVLLLGIFLFFMFSGHIDNEPQGRNIESPIRNTVCPPESTNCKLGD